MKLVVIAMILLLPALSLHAQSPVGKWKFQSWTSETRSGKKTDMLKEFMKDYPCMKDVIYHFTADGKITANADKCPKEVREQSIGTKWISKGKGQIAVDIGDGDPVTYNIEVSGDIMRWTINYEWESGNKEEIRQLVLVYRKV